MVNAFASSGLDKFKMTKIFFVKVCSKFNIFAFFVKT